VVRLSATDANVANAKDAVDWRSRWFAVDTGVTPRARAFPPVGLRAVVNAEVFEDDADAMTCMVRRDVTRASGRFGQSTYGEIDY